MKDRNSGFALVGQELVSFCLLPKSQGKHSVGAGAPASMRAKQSEMHLQGG